MSNEPSEFRPSASGVIEFEPVEPVVVARQLQTKPVDETMDMDPLSIVYGQKKGSKPASGDQMLAGATIDWFVALPAAARPKALCERYPHVANRLARDWPDVALTVDSLMRLAEDARWGSAGFPGLIQAELQRLLQHLGAAPAATAP
ncbi:MAG: hypothetical protein OEU94_07160 [Aquincola sp.]|nr:hypothetical protein [Aquincola sp.]MDH4290230.1 hypothetical protein [Aquincola sp.]MDH5332169.1 hypothetical protein [Aquincola sp.]